ncbi:hypothetical protein Tco_0052365 [Tanacetum coccineum]
MVVTKSAFLNGFINEEVYVAQPPGFIDFKKPDHVYIKEKLYMVLNKHPKLGDIVKSVSTAVHSRTFGVSSVAGSAGIVTVVSLYGPSRMHFLKASPFGLVSMYLRKLIAIEHSSIACIGGRFLKPAA